METRDRMLHFEYRLCPKDSRSRLDVHSGMAGRPLGCSEGRKVGDGLSKGTARRPHIPLSLLLSDYEANSIISPCAPAVASGIPTRDPQNSESA